MCSSFVFAKSELHFQFNRYKSRKLKSIAKGISDKIKRLQNGKCHLDKVVACLLEQECGYACLFHQLTICFVISYYMERTLVIAKPSSKGIGLSETTFEPVTNSCRFNYQKLEESKLADSEPKFKVFKVSEFFVSS